MANILIIDDDEAFRNLVRLQLQRAGHEGVVARDGREIFDDLPAWVRWADLVITDVFMPERDGIETIRALREWCADLPIIVMSGGGHRPEGWHVLDCATQLGATSALHKPFSQKELLETVGQVLGGDGEVARAG